MVAVGTGRIAGGNRSRRGALKESPLLRLTLRVAGLEELARPGIGVGAEVPIRQRVVMTQAATFRGKRRGRKRRQPRRGGIATTRRRHANCPAKYQPCRSYRDRHAMLPPPRVDGPPTSRRSDASRFLRVRTVGFDRSPLPVGDGMIRSRSPADPGMTGDRTDILPLTSDSRCHCRGYAS